MPDKARILTTEAIQAFQAGNHDTAEKLFKKLVTGKQTASPQAFYNFAVFLRHSEKPEQAAYWLDRCLRAEPDRVDARLERSLLHMEAKDPWAVPPLLEDLQDGDALSVLAQAWEALGHWQKALSALEKISNPSLQHRLAMLRCLLELRSDSEAEALATALRKEGSLSEAILAKTMTRRSAGRLTLQETPPS